MRRCDYSAYLIFNGSDGDMTTIEYYTSLSLFTILLRVWRMILYSAGQMAREWPSEGEG